MSISSGGRSGIAAALGLALVAPLVVAVPVWADASESPSQAVTATSQLYGGDYDVAGMPVPPGTIIDIDRLRAADSSHEFNLKVEIRSSAGVNILNVAPLPTSGSVTPNFSVGAGWFIYVYLNNSDINYLIRLSSVAATAALAALIVAAGYGLTGAVAGAMAGYIIGNLKPYRYLAPGRCAQFKFLWIGTVPVGANNVKCP